MAHTCTPCTYSNAALEERCLDLKNVISKYSMTTVPAPIKGAPTIQKFLFWPSNCHIKNA